MKLLTAIAGVAALAASAGADDLVIQSFGQNGKLTWTFPTNGVSEYRIEWCPDLAAGLWHDLKGDMQQVLPTGAVMSVSVPMFYRVKALGPAPADMAYIPAGSFSMGDSFNDGGTHERPVHTVYVSAFYMDKYEVTKAKWDEVYAWAVANGYSFDYAGSGKASGHPVQTVSWYDCVKWCNARSQKEGLTPCYTVGGATYKTGQSEPDCSWTAGGYRLPTEAEWEKAARGGLSGRHFPWGDTVTHGQANYLSATIYAYDTSPTRGYHPTYNDGTYPYTSPAGAFTANGYGLYDMAGNVWEWCWDWLGWTYYSSSPSSDPRGPSSGAGRVERGGSWSGDAHNCSAGSRNCDSQASGSYHLGFRPVRSAP